MQKAMKRKYGQYFILLSLSAINAFLNLLHGFLIYRDFGFGCIFHNLFKLAFLCAPGKRDKENKND